MKFGDTLYERSIPQWNNYNVDYNDIKQLIKTNTANGTSTSITIPGRPPSQPGLRGFERELYAALVENHDRVALFVYSKYGEIQRRLDHLNRRFEALEARRSASKFGDTKIPVKRLERYSRLENETIDAGEELQALGRFVTAQRTAIRKLLKKYQKWAGSSSVGEKFEKNVIASSEYVFQQSFEPLLPKWSNLLESIRSPFQNTNTTTNVNSGVRQKSKRQQDQENEGFSNESRMSGLEQDTESAARLHYAFEHGTDVEVDAALSAVPLGQCAGRANYWVHSDDLVQLQVTVLQHARRRKPHSSTTRSRSSPTTPLLSRKNSGLSSNSNTFESGTITCDNLTTLNAGRSSATIKDIEGSPGNVVEDAAVTIVYDYNDDSSVLYHPQNGKGKSKDRVSVRRSLKMKRKIIPYLFGEGPSQSLSKVRVQTSTGDEPYTNGVEEEFESLRTWLSEHREIHPLVDVRRYRLRFANLHNNNTQGVWVTLDQDICIRKCSVQDINDYPPDCEYFPHSLLEVRWEGHTTPQLVKTLDESHLAERVRGFSMQIHALATVYGSEFANKPFWLVALSRDIRKVPLNPHTPKRRTSLVDKASLSSSSPVLPEQAQLTESAPVTEEPTSSGFSALLQHGSQSTATSVTEQTQKNVPKLPHKKRRTRKEHPLRKQVVRSPIRRAKYWNEFDDGEEAPQDEPFTIFVNPDPPNSSLGSKLFSAIGNAARKIRNLLSFNSRDSLSIKTSTTEEHGGRDPALQEYLAYKPAQEESDIDSDDSTTSLLNPSNRRLKPKKLRHYSSFSKSDQGRGSQDLGSDRATRSRDRLYAGFAAASLLVSFALLCLAELLHLTRRKRYAVDAKVGALSAVLLSLLSVAGTVYLTCMRVQSLTSWEKAGIVGLIAFVVAGGLMVIGQVGQWV